MPDDRSKLNKVIALAINPGAVEEEAVAALRRARAIVQQNPALAHPPTEPKPTPQPIPQGQEATLKITISNAHPDWILIMVGLLSAKAYDLGLMHKIDFDFSNQLTSVKILCDGSESACEAFSNFADWCSNYVNEQLRKPSSQ
jgi:hypothetical protein